MQKNVVRNHLAATFSDTEQGRNAVQIASLVCLHSNCFKVPFRLGQCILLSYIYVRTYSVQSCRLNYPGLYRSTQYSFITHSTSIQLAIRTDLSPLIFSRLFPDSQFPSFSPILSLSRASFLSRSFSLSLFVLMNPPRQFLSSRHLV